ncbi:hypothetical protein [Streptomyces sp. NPDC086010]|uniref:hypothetical protein n=1 Tax=Streptomyces sp. NPDC086010 TaxID=3365745 RepID=UPI0037D3EB8E
MPHSDRENITSLVHAFYGRLVADPLIGLLFSKTVDVDRPWVMTDCWESSPLTQRVPHERPAAHRALHAGDPLRHEHFDRRLLLWTTTVG